MTDTIKQWIADQAKDFVSDLGKNGAFNMGSIEEGYCNADFGAGLTKGIEIAEGFELWKIKIGAVQRITGMYVYPNCNKPCTFYELLEKYLEQLGK